MQSFLISVKRILKDELSPYPSIFIPMYRALAPRHNVTLLISPRTEIVIEGFPRSANTFAVVAFLQAQKRLVQVAHHLHAEAQVLEGARRQIPVLVLIRHPEKAIRSLAVRHPQITLGGALRRYISFYSAVKKARDRVVVSDFEQTTRHLGSVIKKVNEKFGSDFSVFEDTPQNLAAVFAEIDDISERLGDNLSTHIAQPNAGRDEIYQNMCMDFQEQLLLEAVSLYESLTLNA